ALEARREGHAEARRLRRRQQLLGVRPRLTAEAGAEVERPTDLTARPLEAPLPALESTLPRRVRLAGRHLRPPSLGSGQLRRRPPAPGRPATPQEARVDRPRN